MSRFFLFFLASITCFHSFGQFDTKASAYYNQINIAKTFIADGKIDSAIAHYETALHNFNGKGHPWLQLGNLYKQQANYPKAIEAYKIAVLNGYFPCTGQYFDDFPSEKDGSLMEPFLKSLDSLKSVFYRKTFNWEFSDLVKALEGADQSVRVIWATLDEIDTMQSVFPQRLIGFTDSLYALPKLLKYLDTHPFPEENTLDSKTMGSFWIIVHHNLQYDKSNANVAKLRSIIESAVFKGKYDLRLYIRSLDYYHMGRFGKQLYGTYLGRKESGEYIYSMGIDSISTVDSRRAAWHMLPLYMEQKYDETHPLPPQDYDPKRQKK